MKLTVTRENGEQKIYHYDGTLDVCEIADFLTTNDDGSVSAHFTGGHWEFERDPE